MIGLICKPWKTRLFRSYFSAIFDIFGLELSVLKMLKLCRWLTELLFHKIVSGGSSRVKMQTLKRNSEKIKLTQICHLF